MYIFSKWRILFSSLVLLKIIKAVTECIFSIVIKVCDEIEFTLKSDENFALSQNVLPRMKINSINNQGLNYTRSQVSYSIDRNIEPDSVDFLISNLPTGKKVSVRHLNRHQVVTNVSDVTYDDLNNKFQRRALTVESSSVFLKPDNFPGKILESSTPLDLRSRVSKSRSKQPEITVIKIPPECTRSLQNAEQVLSSKIFNASAGSSCCKPSISDTVDKLESNESNNSANSFSDSVSLNVPQQIVKYTHKTPSSDIVDLTQRNVHQGNKITQSSEKQSFIDDECHSELVTAVHNAFQCYDNASKNHLDDFEKNDHIQRNNCQKLKQVEETREEVKLSSPNVNAQGCDGSRNTALDTRLKVKFSSKVDAQICDYSCKTLEDEFIDIFDDFSDDETEKDGTDKGSPSSAEIWRELVKTGKPAYTDFLKETLPLLKEIEMDVLKWCEVHYCKTLRSKEEIIAIDLKLGNLAKKSREVNTKPYHGSVIIYIREVIEVFTSNQKYIEYHMDPNTTNAMKLSVYLEQVSRALTQQRDLLFQANDDTRALQKQFQQVVKVPWRKIRKNRKRK